MRIALLWVALLFPGAVEAQYVFNPEKSQRELERDWEDCQRTLGARQTEQTVGECLRGKGYDLYVPGRPVKVSCNRKAEVHIRKFRELLEQTDKREVLGPQNEAFVLCMFTEKEDKEAFTKKLRENERFQARGGR